MEVVEAIKRGDQRVFTEVFDAFHGKVFGFFLTRFHGDRDLAMELTQLTYIKLWQSRHTLSLLHPLDKQLFIIAKYTLIDHLRKEARFSKLKQKAAAGAGPEGTEAQHTLFEGQDYVMTRLRGLPPTRRKVLQLKVLQGYSNKEIASHLSISVKTVEDHVTKGLSELRTASLASVSLTFFYLLL
ncbi:MAG: sigma-70 family RNA polymerase sigma factor [Bacteroidetes bacterium]|nr:sigma-70 family RNA polymerase sigma factor [Bacteroidota bacterium]